MQRIQSISARFRILFKLALVSVPVLNLVLWTFYDKLPSEVTITLLPHYLNLTDININPTTKLMSFFASMLQVSVVMYALVILLKLFKNYQQGIIFSLENVYFYRKLGYSVFAWFISDKLVDVLVSFILTFQNTVGQRQVSVRFGSSDLVALAVGALIILIAWVMNEGHKLNEEQSLTI
jgi:hypothetical protein